MSGHALDVLAKAGIDVKLAECERAVRMLKYYNHHRKYNRPYVTAKAGISLDGKMALASGKSKWITCDRSRQDAHKLRLKCGAILVGTGTALIDKPSLNVRLDGELGIVAKDVKPIRCFIDYKGQVRDGPLLDISLGPVIVFTGPQCDNNVKALWLDYGLEVVTISHGLNEILDFLGKKGIHRLLVEGGPRLITSFIDGGLVNELILYQAPVLMGLDGQSLYTRFGLDNINHDWKITNTKRFDSDIRIKLTPI
jgi:diaminohydroxyphosphoribosylaminopyrimidine deaminase/5-amino-6-(5-phosphoribosylamino)uracil reductase